MSSFLLQLFFFFRYLFRWWLITCTLSDLDEKLVEQSFVQSITICFIVVKYKMILVYLDIESKHTWSCLISKFEPVWMSSRAISTWLWATAIINGVAPICSSIRLTTCFVVWNSGLRFRANSTNFISPFGTHKTKEACFQCLVIRIFSFHTINIWTSRIFYQSMIQFKNKASNLPQN